MNIHVVQDVLQDINGNLDIFTSRDRSSLFLCLLFNCLSILEYLGIYFRGTHKGCSYNRVSCSCRFKEWYWLLVLYLLFVELFLFFVKKFLVFILELLLVFVGELFFVGEVGAKDGVSHFRSDNGPTAARTTGAYSYTHTGLFAPDAESSTSWLLYYGDFH